MFEARGDWISKLATNVAKQVKLNSSGTNFNNGPIFEDSSFRGANVCRDRVFGFK